MKKLPGMTITAEGEDFGRMLESLFSSGGLFLSQVCTVTGLEQHTVQNWVKRGFVSPPKKKLYSKNQLCRIAMISMLRNALPLETVLHLLKYINGRLDDESDDLIDDSLLYLKFCSMIFKTGILEEEISKTAEKISENIADDKSRRRTAYVLEAMYCAWCSSEYKIMAEEKIGSMEENIDE